MVGWARALRNVLKASKDGAWFRGPIRLPILLCNKCEDVRTKIEFSNVTTFASLPCIEKLLTRTQRSNESSPWDEREREKYQREIFDSS